MIASTQSNTLKANKLVRLFKIITKPSLYKHMDCNI